MPRSKSYNETEVVDKAMHLFWQKGFENTSVRMLEKKMGINQFSIYASFESKQGVFLECIEAYKRKLKDITDMLATSENGVEGIKDHFYRFLEFSRSEEFRGKGCLIVNTANELTEHSDPRIRKAIFESIEEIKLLFVRNLKQEKNKDSSWVAQNANYLIISLMSLASASRLFDREMLANFIESTFNKV